MAFKNFSFTNKLFTFIQTVKMKNELQLSNTEIKMMREVYQIFYRYRNQTREFGLQLIHSHFPIKQDEILYEVHNAEKRILITCPKKRSSIKKALATGWQFNNSNGQIEVNNLCCDVSAPPEAPSRK